MEELKDDNLVLVIRSNIEKCISTQFNAKPDVSIWENLVCYKDGVSLKWENKYRGKSIVVKYVLDIIVDELNTKLNDYKLAEYFVRDTEMQNETDFKVERSEYQKRFDFFFKNLTSNKWLNERYINKITNEYKLPQYEMLIQLSALEYEKRYTKSSIWLYDSDYKFKNKLRIRFESDNNLKMDMTNMRSVKKLLELAGEDNALAVEKKIDNDGRTFYEMQGIHKCYSEKGIYIEFMRKLSWKLKIKRHRKRKPEELMTYKEGTCIIPLFKAQKVEEEMLNKVNIYLEKHGINNSDGVKNIIDKVFKESVHGTSLIFIGNDDFGSLFLNKEKRRFSLSERARVVEPFPFEEKFKQVKGIIEIDGAVMLDTSGKCHAVGVIVDGKATKKGNAGRGARYNSLCTYISSIYEEEQNQNVVALVAVISEDKTLDVITGDDFINPSIEGPTQQASV